MTANIFGDRFLGHREPAWHGLGKTFEEPISASEAVKLCGLDYNVVKLPLAGMLQTPMGTQLVTAGDRVMLAREPTPDDPEYRFFGVAGKDYGIIQNTAVAAALDALTSVWPVETVGAIGKGETTFFTLDAGEMEIKGEAVHEYFLVTDTKNGGTALKIAYTPVRVVCQNTLVTGIREAIVSASLEHHANVEGEFNFRIGLVDQMNKARQQVAGLFDKMASVVISQEEAESIFLAAYPIPRKPAMATLLETEYDEMDIAALGSLYSVAGKSLETWEEIRAKLAEFRTAASGLFSKINDQYTDIANTPWAAYNAVVELADFRRGKDSASASALFGSRAKEKINAFKAAMVLTTDHLA